MPRRTRLRAAAGWWRHRHTYSARGSIQSSTAASHGPVGMDTASLRLAPPCLNENAEQLRFQPRDPHYRGPPFPPQCLRKARQEKAEAEGGTASDDPQEERMRYRQYEQPGELVTLPSGERYRPQVAAVGRGGPCNRQCPAYWPLIFAPPGGGAASYVPPWNSQLLQTQLTVLGVGCCSLAPSLVIN
jgi:hypothetical protein